jgi:hypothetical protein
MTIKHTKWKQIVPNDHKMYQMVIKCIDIFHCKTHQNLPKLRVSVWKYTLWQPCSRSHKRDSVHGTAEKRGRVNSSTGISSTDLPLTAFHRPTFGRPRISSTNLALTAFHRSPFRRPRISSTDLPLTTFHRCSSTDIRSECCSIQQLWPHQSS